MLGIELLKRLGGGSGNPIVLTDDSVSGTRYTQWVLGSDGFTYRIEDSGAATKGPAWINPQTGMNLYEVEVTVATGNTPPGTIGSWINAATAPSWGWLAQDSEKSCDLTVSIRRASDSVVVGGATISLFNSGIQ